MLSAEAEFSERNVNLPSISAILCIFIMTEILGADKTRMDHLR